jgi:acetylglutamate kinase
MTHENHNSRAEALIEALPFIQKYRGQVIVIKYGGSAMDDEHIVERLLRDIIFLEAVGVNPVLVHGGGSLITDKMRSLGIRAKFVNGLRATDEKSIGVVEEVLDRVINPRIVNTLNEFGGRAVGLSGTRIFLAQRLPPQSEGKKANIDVGFVGEVTDLHLDEVQEALAEEKIPVISPIAQDGRGITLNVNADSAAGAMASALKAAKLIFLSDVPGIMRDPKESDSLIPSVHCEMVSKLLEEEVISGGMIPKVKAAVSALGKGVGKIHLIDGRIAHSLLLEIFTNLGVGTEIVA